MRWGVVWTDHGRPLPFADVFAEHLAGVKDRLGTLEERSQARRRRRRIDDTEDPTLIVRQAVGSRVYLDQGVPEK